MSGIVAEEVCGSPLKKKTLYTLDNDRLIKVKSSRDGSTYGFGNFLYEVFFPEGYPDSVSKDYLTYQVFDTIQAFCSYVNGTIATQSVLTGLGVGEEASTALAATMTWVLKDGVGMIGRIVFAWAQGTDLDSDMKRWRLRADFFNDVATFLDIVSSQTRYFAFIICISALLRSIVGIAGTGTRPAIILHQARRNNLGDVTAKDASQETMVHLTAMIVALVIMPWIAHSHLLSWTVFFLLAFIHVLANYCGVKSLNLEQFNQSRFHLAVSAFLNSGGTFVPSIREVNRQEPVIVPLYRKWRYSIGCRLPRRAVSGGDFIEMREIYGDEVFCLMVNPSKGHVAVFLSPAATPADVIRAAFEVELIGHKLLTHFSVRDTVLEVMRQTRMEAGDLYERFEKLARNEGFDFARNYLGARDWRLTWRSPDARTADFMVM
ncbi:RUS family member 1-like isoform X2 [Paramacrobiotus metropolitanus]|uniref:RUS family member 1-like isoform X2 n=1 Tax=Paramacrobiotus metropolitanus TaxID=2943436 RepID=UPI002445AADF|nr:RUS family member 1-like isoform X2 [Paramacrobiotus metropolitanus]